MVAARECYKKKRQEYKFVQFDGSVESLLAISSYIGKKVSASTIVITPGTTSIAKPYYQVDILDSDNDVESSIIVGDYVLFWIDREGFVNFRTVRKSDFEKEYEVKNSAV